MYLSTSTEDFPEMYLSTLQVLYKLYLSTDVLKYKVLLPGSGCHCCVVTSLYRLQWLYDVYHVSTGLMFLVLSS